MDLDSLDVKESKFSEVKELQVHFSDMVSRMKLYRSFVPAHILRDETAFSNGDNLVDFSTKSRETSHSAKQSSWRLGTSRYNQDTDKLERRSLFYWFI